MYICVLKNNIMLKKFLLTLTLGLGLSTVAFCQEGVQADNSETKVEATTGSKKSCCASKSSDAKTSCSKAESKKSCSASASKDTKSCSGKSKKSCSGHASADSKKCSGKSKASCSKGVSAEAKTSCSKDKGSKKCCADKKKA